MTTPTNDLTRLAFYGDSTQWGSRNKHQLEETNAVALADRLFWAAGIIVVLENHGAPGLDTNGRLHGRASGPEACSWETEMAHGATRRCAVYGTEMTHVQCGTNAHWVINNTLINDIVLAPAPVSKATFKQWYHELAQTAANHGRLFVIETPNPVSNVYGTVYASDADKVTRFLEFMAAQHEVAASRRLVLIDQYKVITEYVDNWQAAFVEDTLHPNGVIYAAKAINTFWTMAPHLDPDGGWSTEPISRSVFVAAFEAFIGKAEGTPPGSTPAQTAKRAVEIMRPKPT